MLLLNLKKLKKMALLLLEVRKDTSPESPSFAYLRIHKNFNILFGIVEVLMELCAPVPFFAIRRLLVDIYAER